MTSKSKELAIALPTASKLLVSNDPDEKHPPIFLKLSPNAMELLARSCNKPTNVSLSLSDSSTSLRIDDFEFHGTHIKESGHVEVYLPEQSHDGNSDGEGTFRSHGQIESRITIKQGDPEKLKPEPIVEASAPRIAKLLSSAPHSVANLIASLQLPENEIRKVLSEIAEPHGEELFILKTRAAPKRNSTKSGSGAASATTSDVKPRTVNANQKTSSLSTSKHEDGRPRDRSSGNGRAADDLSHKPRLSPSLKRQSASSSSEPKRLRKSDGGDDMFELARKFRSAYDEYLELYSLLSKRETRPASQVQKLVAMHNQLAQWKKTLWSNARSKSQVQ